MDQAFSAKHGQGEASPMPVGGDSGLQDIRDRALSSADASVSLAPGRVREEGVLPGYVEKGHV